jgi:LacI family transcriptional regulator
MAMIAETQDDVDRMGRVISNLLSRSVDAIITTAARKGTERVLRKAYDQVPVVLADRSLVGGGLFTVAPDDVLGGRLAAQHLIELGHTSLVEIAGPADVSSFERRSTGFRQAAASAGVEVAEVADTAIEPTVAEGRRIARAILDTQSNVTCFFAHNDLMALGVLDVLNERGLRCPEDVSVVGYDDLPLTAYTTPALTTVRLPGYQLGRMAAEIAVSLSEADGDPTDLTIAPTLVERESTGPPPGLG